MQDFPHRYRASASAGPEGLVTLASPGLEAIPSAPPPEFDGPGGRWSPELLLVAAVADCFTLTFRAIAQASRLDWSGLRCEVEGTLEREGHVTRFTGFVVRASLDVPSGADPERARKLLVKAEEGCLVTNSLSAAVRLETEVLQTPG